MTSTPQTFGLDDLLTEREWLRALAGRLAGGDDADDLAQDVWVATLRSPPGRAGRPRAWLATILRNLARNRRRDDFRRDRAENAAPVRAGAPAPDELVSRAEAEARVARAVADLEEPYRRTVLLRWHEGHAPAAIARIDGVPVETVKTRLKRAHAMLRERLDGGPGGRRGWAVLALPAPGAGTTASGWAGAVAAAIVVVAACLCAAHFAMRGEGDDDAAAVPEAPRAGSIVPGPVRPPAAAEPAPARVVLTGRVVREEGLDAVADAAVVLAGRDRDVAEARTAADGSFRLEMATRHAADSVLVRAPGLATTRVALPTLPRAGDVALPDIRLGRSTRLLVKVRGPDGGPVPGARIDAYRIPDPGPFMDSRWNFDLAAELPPEASALADASGTAWVPDVAWASYTVVARAPGFGAMSILARTSRATGAGLEAELTLPRAATLRGTVTDGSGRPIAGLRVLAGPGFTLSDPYSCRVATTTGPDGAFEFDSVPEGDALVWSALPGVVPFVVATVRTPDVATVAVRLEAGGIVTGTLRDAATNAPIGGARVRAVGYGERGGSGAIAIAWTDPLGRYEIRGLPPGRLGPVTASAPGYHEEILVRSTGELAATGERLPPFLVGTTAVVDGLLPSGGSFTGRVTVNGAPAPWTDVILDEMTGAPMERLGLHRSTRTAFDGTFRLDELPRFRAVIRVNGPSGWQRGLHDAFGTMQGWGSDLSGAPAEWVLDLTKGGSVDRDLDLAPCLAVRGKVVDRAGNPVAGASVSGQGPVWTRAWANRNGEFRLSGLLPGAAVQIRAGAKGFAIATASVTLEEGAPEPFVELVLGSTTRVRGIVRTPDGSPLRNGRVWFTGAPASPADDSWRGTEYRATAVGPDGRFDVEFALSFDTPVAVAAADGWAVSRSDPVTIRRGEATDGVEVVLSPRRRVAGRVVLRGTGHPVAGARVGWGATFRVGAVRREGEFAASFAAGDQRVAAVTGADGGFALDDVSPVEIDVAAVHPRGSAASARVPFPSKGDILLEVEEYLSVSGVVVHAGGAPASAVVLRAVPCVEPAWNVRPEDERVTATDAEGRFEFRSLPPGRWRVLFPRVRVGEEERGIRLPVEVEAGASGLRFEIP